MTREGCEQRLKCKGNVGKREGTKRAKRIYRCKVKRRGKDNIEVSEWGW